MRFCREGSWFDPWVDGGHFKIEDIAGTLGEFAAFQELNFSCENATTAPLFMFDDKAPNGIRLAGYRRRRMVRLAGAEMRSLLLRKGGKADSPAGRGWNLLRVCLGWYAGKKKRRIGSAYEEEAVWRLTERF